MKKILAFLLAVSMIFAMAACAASPAQTTTEPAKTEEAAATEPAAAEETTAEPAAPAEDTTTTGADKGSPDTGVAGVAGIAGVAVLAGAAVVIARKRK